MRTNKDLYLNREKARNLFNYNNFILFCFFLFFIFIYLFIENPIHYKNNNFFLTKNFNKFYKTFMNLINLGIN
jgi:hypothetical protein